MFSGTADKFIPLGVLVQTAANLGLPVSIFVTAWAIMGFTKDGQIINDNIYFLKSFTTLNTAKLINTKDIAEAVNELSIDA
jgi:peroxiredoxin family protein